MQDFIANGGKVTAFTTPDNTVIQLRKPQVHKVSNKLMCLTMKTKGYFVPLVDAKSVPASGNSSPVNRQCVGQDPGGARRDQEEGGRAEEDKERHVQVFG